MQHKRCNQILAIIAATSLLGACELNSGASADVGGGGQQTPAAELPAGNAPTDSNAVTLTPLELPAGLPGGPVNRTITVIRDDAAWAAWWQRHGHDAYIIGTPDGAISTSPLPAVDFSRHTLLISSGGAGTSCGPGARFGISRVEREASRLVVHVNYPSPPPASGEPGFERPGPICAQVITSESAVYSIPRTTLPIVVKEEQPLALGLMPVVAMNVVQGDTGATVIRTPDQWTAFWTPLTGGDLPAPEAPSGLVAGYGNYGMRWFALSSGPLPSPCYHRVIREVRRYFDHYRVVYEDVPQAPGQFCSAVLAYEASVVSATTGGEDDDFGPVEWVPVGTDLTRYTPR